MVLFLWILVILKMQDLENHKIYRMSVASVYTHYIVKVEKKQRSQAELNTVICWLTGYNTQQLQEVLDNKTDFETFFANAPNLNPNAHKITGLICGVRIETITHPLMQQIRYMDKLVDELAKGKALAKILRT
jgi:hypothetical protein